MAASPASCADRAARSRAILMAIGAVILLVTAAMNYGSPADAAPTLRGGLWLAQIALFTLLLATGGGLNLSPRVRAVMNDELSLRNRAQAISAGFATAIVAALALYIASWFTPIALQDGVRLITAPALAVALLRYAWLELR